MVAVVAETLHDGLIVPRQRAAGAVETHPAYAVGFGHVQPVPQEVHTHGALESLQQGFHRVRVPVPVGVTAQQQDIPGVGPAHQQVAGGREAQEPRPRQVRGVQLQAETLGQLQSLLHLAGGDGGTAHAGHDIEDHAQAAAVYGPAHEQRHGHGGQQHYDNQQTCQYLAQGAVLQ